MVRMDGFSGFDSAYRPQGDGAVISTMDFEGHGVRIIMRGDAPWFVLADVCRVLEVGNPSHAASRLDDDEKDTLANNEGIADSRVQTLIIINESGLYSLILTSRKAAAKRFKKWVTAEVLPTIRRTGGYGAALSHGSDMPRFAMDEAMKLTSRELNAYARVVGEARRVAGRSSAVFVWVQTPLPALPDRRPAPLPQIAVDALPPRRSVDGPACLARLLACPVARRPGVTLGDMVSLARHDAATRNGLIKIGIMVNPANWRGWVAIAMDHRGLQRAFVDSPWSSNWAEALGGIRGARLGHDIDGFDHGRRSVLIPWEKVADSLN